MTKLTTERLEYYAALPTQPADGDGFFKKGIFMYEVRRMARQLLAYEQAAKNPVAFTEACEISNMNATGLYMRGFPDSKQGRNIPIYAAPVLPKQPELVGMKVSIDTGGDNIGHRLFGEIVGTSDSNGVPVLCIEVAENNADVTLADEGKTAKIVKAAEKLVRCKGRYHSEQNYRALAALFGVTVPDLPPLPSDEAPIQPESEIPFGDVEPIEVTDDMVFAFHNQLSDSALGSDEFTDIKHGLCAALMNIPRPAQPVIPELRYGDNVLWFLNELAAFDASDIDSDDFDVYGEDRNGMEGCATISITELAADAAKLLSAQPVSEPYKFPQGWKLVPIEPTAAMFHAFNDCDYGRKSMRERYIQMIEAAPARESE